jgi:hypothetical protein
MTQASAACFEQDTLCYSSSPPTGSKNCAIWEAKCDGIQAACKADSFNGPPDHGKNLNPTPAIVYTIPSAAAENGGAALSASPTRTSSASTAFSLMQLPGYTPDAIVPVSLVTDTFLPTISESTSRRLM